MCTRVALPSQVRSDFNKFELGIARPKLGIGSAFDHPLVSQDTETLFTRNYLNQLLIGFVARQLESSLIAAVFATHSQTGYV